MNSVDLATRLFLYTRPRPCPYVPGRSERNLVTSLQDSQQIRIFDELSRMGFRRSHALAYKPACRACNACVPVRIVTGQFSPSRSQRRILARNRDLAVRFRRPHATAEQFDLFRLYQRARHGEGDMAQMSFADYRAMIEDSPVESYLAEHRTQSGDLVAVCLLDRLGDGYSAVYSFYAPDLEKRSLGTFVILNLIAEAQALRLPFVYLGYWIQGSRKMDYKTRFEPMEKLVNRVWQPLVPADRLPAATILPYMVADRTGAR